MEDPSLRQRLLEITVLSSFAVGQPLLWLVVDNPTFAVVHGLTGFQLIAFGIAVVALPALALGLLASLLAVGPRPLSVWSHRLIVGVLLAAIVTPAINRALGFDHWWALVAFALVSTLGILAYTRLATLRTLIRYAVIAPLLLPVLFSFSGPIRPLVRATPVDLPPISAASAPPVVWLVFDQLPLALLLDSEGEIAEDRFPNFARLRSLGTWYPKATSITPNTDTSMTATLTGLYPTPGAPSVTAQYPANAFTLLGGLYEVKSHERVTGLCPETICESVEDRQPPRTRLFQDSAIVVGRLLLPDGVADLFLPEVDSQWGEFGAAGSGGGSAPRVYREDRAEFLSFVEDLGSSDAPAFHYFHMEKPHEPLLMIPDGRIYDYCSCYYTEEGGRWPDDEVMLAQRLQRYVMQTMYVDHELGLVLDRLERLGTLDETLILVMSDHGASMIPGNVNRSVDPETADEVFSVPLFIKYPNQQSGTVDL
ncbi:MAG TPA: sulfatase-like hydrolase/transferase, partial [Acidimicrobiia bacterium]